MKEKIKKGYLRITKKLREKELYTRNIMKGTNT